MIKQPSTARAQLAIVIREALVIADAEGELIVGCHLAAALDDLEAAERAPAIRATTNKRLS